MRCTECGSEMRFTSEPMKEMYKGGEFTVAGMERWVCDKCGNDVMKADEADRLSRELADAYAVRKSLLTPGRFASFANHSE
ncbi:YgiT-type zinc finger protein [Collinsella ihumii]|uniref:YgiT-type zinc finger protein n=1 Tax=Collinsella ihumii TaxID=1720204 RepID=UPI00082AE3D6|nr:YgiT-type zinc finger protein [Collinsella ihumii]MCF6413451.1 YgiT-type zinc finger protein [Collinsella tanakaei]